MEQARLVGEKPQVSAAAATHLSSSAKLLSEELYVYVQDTTPSKKFSGDDAPSTDASADPGTLTTTDTATLYKDTTSYDFSPGGSNADTIYFKNKDATVIGSWSGTFKPALKSAFSGTGSWN